MIIYFILFNLAVWFDAAGDALIKKRDFIVAKFYQLMTICVFMSMIVLAQILPWRFVKWHELLYFFGMYVFVRIALFNIIWNLYKFNRSFWWYIGDTDLWDKAINWVMTKLKVPYKMFLFWFYLLCYLFSLFILIQGFYVTNI